MRKILLVILYYVIACILIVVIHPLSPTNMAGPGLDIVVYFLTLVVGLALVTRSVIKWNFNDKIRVILFLINLIGISLIIALLIYVLNNNW